MRVRLLVIAAFVSLSTVPGVLAYDAGLLSARVDASRPSDGASGEFRLTSLGWPGRALGLTAARDLIVWHQPGGGDAGGMWAYDVRQQRVRRLVGPRALGRPAGPPAMSGPSLAWPVRPPSGDGPPQVKVFDTDIGRLYVAARGGRPSLSGDWLAWSRRDAAGSYVLGATELVTGERGGFRVEGRVKDIAAWGGWIAWLAGPAKAPSLWATRLHSRTRYLLAPRASAFAVSGERLMWAVPQGRGKTALAVWDRLADHSRQLAVVPGRVTDLVLGRGVAAWSRPARGGADIWAYDFESGTASAVTRAAGDQVDPVVVGRTLFWADHRNGHWAVYGRQLKPAP